MRLNAWTPIDHVRLETPLAPAAVRREFNSPQAPPAGPVDPDRFGAARRASAARLDAMLAARADDRQPDPAGDRARVPARRTAHKRTPTPRHTDAPARHVPVQRDYHLAPFVASDSRCRCGHSDVRSFLFRAVPENRIATNTPNERGEYFASKLGMAAHRARTCAVCHTSVPTWQR